MKNRIQQLVRLLLSPSQSADKQGVIVLIAFLFASTLWFVVTMNQTYEASLLFPYKVVNVPETMQMIDSESNEVEVVVRGVGVNLMTRYLRSRNDTLEFPFMDDYRKFGFVQSNIYNDEVAKFLSSSLTVERINPVRISLQLEDKIYKRVRLYSRANINLKPAYQLDSVKLLVDSVTILGPQTVLDTIDHWYTSSEKTILVEEEKTLTIKVVDTIEGIQVTPSEVPLYVNPRLYTQATVRVPVSVTGLPGNVKVRLDPTHVELSCLVPMDTYDKVIKEFEKFTVPVAFDQFDPRIPRFIPSIDLPNHVKLIHRAPMEVSYVIMES